MTRKRFSFAKRKLTRQREKSIDQRMPLKPDHRLPPPFQQVADEKHPATDATRTSQ
jgi:hypothetical protein